MLALSGLHTSQLVSAHAHFALLCQLWGLLIQATDGFDRFLLVRILRRGQPIADQMRLEIVFFPSGQKTSRSGGSPALLKGGKIGLALVAEAKALELLALGNGGLPSQFAPAGRVKLTSSLL